MNLFDTGSDVLRWLEAFLLYRLYKKRATSLDDVKIVIVGDDSISTDMQPKAVDGNLVYLCHSATDDTDEILECYGLGIVRSVDTVNEKLYLLPSISTNELQHSFGLSLKILWFNRRRSADD
ncbi:hypothetical protein Bhyg_13423 [Pseudolycoriella hygida]|uniref:NOL9 C-terminal domain-containing protein n=1 Tax=Pseudolycoriella hygida TaxID=35572 RepID=A0A9Q0RWG3_9DIPT|nr:hypothetical protein Bhyg_13423 [Pseudolycoriella hygida]